MLRVPNVESIRHRRRIFLRWLSTSLQQHTLKMPRFPSAQLAQVLSTHRPPSTSIRRRELVAAQCLDRLQETSRSSHQSRAVFILSRRDGLSFDRNCRASLRIQNPWSRSI